MIIKKFTAGTETEAILLAKEELGKDAIVMNIKKNRPRGIYRLFRKETVEVTAAIDENTVYQSKMEEQRARDLGRKNPNIIYEDEPAGFDSLLADKTKNVFASHDNSTAIEQRLNELQDLLKSQLAERSAKAEPEKKETEPEEEEQDANLACIRMIYNQLVSNEVDEQYANQVIGEIEHKLKKDAGINNILMSMYQKLVLKLGQIKTIELEEDKVRYIFFIGPTGVGKTTTIAKLASMLKMNQKKKVALLTADTYRIAAVEQLTTYANILDIPLQVIYSADELKEIKDKLEEYDVVLVDTAGRSHKSKEQRDDVESLLQAVPEEERDIFLVLSATTKYQDLIKITEIYSEITDYSLIFTKLDETGSIGNILNIHMKTGAPLSYATFGQNVPDDIYVIDPQNIAKQLLGGSE
ncbi:MAG: flagellar biosynthesis protein FlhF [Lachnospiraceae bacterium]|nr:flagellar biosynthesis protein FlhF [Lachnospiraceae bacterium]